MSVEQALREATTRTTRALASLVLSAFACGGRAATPASPPQTLAAPGAATCVDRRSEGRTFAMYASSDPTDVTPVDRRFPAAWDQARPRFEACGEVAHERSKATRVAVELRVSAAGVITFAGTAGPDPAVNRCVCERVLAIAFPSMTKPVAAWFALILAPR